MSYEVPPIRPLRPDARREARRAGRIRLATLIAVVAVLVAALIAVAGGQARSRGAGQTPSGHQGATGSSTLPPSASAGPAAIEAGLLPWQLNGALSRTVVLPAADGHSLIVAGGLEIEGSGQGVFEVNTSNGSATQVGDLVAPLHDAAGVVIGGKGYIYGGGTAVPLDSAQLLPSLGSSKPSSSTKTATSLAPLPQARADDTAVTVGSTSYVVGGYDGSHGDAAVLATTDGTRFTRVADLPVPVRYAAVAALGGLIYVFGGDAADGPQTGDPVSTVQVIDPGAHTARIVGSLPEPLAGAAAAVLGGVVYVAGGETAPPSRPAATPTAVSTIWAWEPTAAPAGRFAVAGQLRVGVSHAGLAVMGNRAWLVGGETSTGTPSVDVQMFEPNSAFGFAGSPGAGSPYFGDKLLIADRGNNRLLLLDDTGKIVWTYPSAKAPPPPGSFYFPDDAFFINHGTAIISNQEDNDTVIEIAFPSGKLLWSYGHPKSPGSAPGYLNSPDDAYLLRNGEISVADPMNCRVIILNAAKKIQTQIGTPGSCIHTPPNHLGSPNGDTPLADGNLLVSEINGSWIDEYTITGHLVWAVQLPIGYPSDPQPLSTGKYLVANYETPGGFVEFDKSGHIFYKYGPSSGTGELNRPSLVEAVPSGVLMANDDYNDRMMAIDPATGALVWQYGQTGVAGTAPGLLNIPDGFDLLGPGGTYPTHPVTG